MGISRTQDGEGGWNEQTCEWRLGLDPNERRPGSFAWRDVVRSVELGRAFGDRARANEGQERRQCNGDEQGRKRSGAGDQRASYGKGSGVAAVPRRDTA